VTGQFVADDFPDIVQHPVVTGDAAWYRVLEYDYMGRALGTGANTLRPLTTLMFALEWRLWGPWPAPFHAVSILCFALLSWSVARLLAGFLPRRHAVAGAAWFAVLAIHVDAVGLVANRAEVLSLLLAVWALRCGLVGRPVAAALLHAAALLAKESAVLLPLVLLWHAVVYERRAFTRQTRRGRALVALLAVSIGFVLLRSQLLDLRISGHILGADNMLQEADLATRLWMPFALLGRYLALTLVPLRLSFDYTYDAIPVALDPGDGHAWLGMAAVLALAGAAVAWRRAATGRSRRQLRPVAFAAGAFAVSYALFSNSLFLIVTLFAERLFLAPSLWLALLGAALVRHLSWRWPRWTPALRAIALLAVAVQLPAAVLRTAAVRSPQALFASQVRSQPASVKGRLYHARELAGRGEHREALWQLGVSMAGRNAFPGRFWPPDAAVERLPIEQRLHRLPALLAPGVEARRFWYRYRSAAAQFLGPGVHRVIDELVVQSPGPE
jgi:hypothetical protein